MEKLALQQFRQETAELTSALKTKEMELGEQNTYVIREAGPPIDTDVGKILTLEAQIKELRSKIYAAAEKYGMSCVQLP
jgi:hypothetical protein